MHRPAFLIFAASLNACLGTGAIKVPTHGSGDAPTAGDSAAAGDTNGAGDPATAGDPGDGVDPGDAAAPGDTATAPSAELTQTPADPTTAPRYTFRIGGTDVTAYRYRIDGGAWQGGTDGRAVAQAATGCVGHGEHTIEVIGVDANGTWQADADATTYTWTVVELTVPTAGGQRRVPVNAEGNPLGYYEYLPPSWFTEPSRQYPVVLFLHGLGEKGDGDSSLCKVLIHGPPKLLQTDDTFLPEEAIVISPQHDGSGNWPGKVPDAITILESYASRIDSARRYLTGLSLGGNGTFWGVLNNPAYFAAAVPVAGWSPTVTVANACAQGGIRIWALHGTADGTVSCNSSRNAIHDYNALDCDSVAAGVQPPSPLACLTTYPGVGHDSWTRTYQPSHTDYPGTWAWMFAASGAPACPVLGPADDPCQ